MISEDRSPAGMPTEAVWTARAPGRVNLIGEHIDYNDGWVLPMAIEREVVIHATPQPEPRATFFSAALGETIDFDLSGDSAEVPHWGTYLQGVLAVFARETGAAIPGFRARIESTVPRGGGLSSSAALEVAAMTLLEKITGRRLPPIEKALLCREVEHTYAGMPCGIMDQMASTLCTAGHFLLIDCMTHETRPIPLGDPEIAVLITNSGVSHALAESEYARRREESGAALQVLGVDSYRDSTLAMVEAGREALGDIRYRRARHVVTEMTRTLDAARALENQDWESLGAAMYASHDSLAHDYAVSCPELDCLVEAARNLGPERGVIGSRMTGGGFGGSTVTLVWRDQADAVARALGAALKGHFGHAPESFLSQPAQGAS